MEAQCEPGDKDLLWMRQGKWAISPARRPHPSPEIQREIAVLMMSTIMGFVAEGEARDYEGL